MENEIYREALIDLFENPTNRGEMADPDLQAHVVNNLCGDEIKLQIKFVNYQSPIANLQIEKVLFSGDGCLLSQVSTSLLSSFLEGKSMEAVKKINKDVILNLVGFTPTPSRMKCALLSLDALKEALDGSKSKS